MNFAAMDTAADSKKEDEKQTDHNGSHGSAYDMAALRLLKPCVRSLLPMLSHWTTDKHLEVEARLGQFRPLPSGGLAGSGGSQQPPPLLREWESTVEDFDAMCSFLRDQAAAEPLLWQITEAATTIDGFLVDGTRCTFAMPPTSNNSGPVLLGAPLSAMRKQTKQQLTVWCPDHGRTGFRVSAKEEMPISLDALIKEGAQLAVTFVRLKTRTTFTFRSMWEYSFTQVWTGSSIEAARRQPCQYEVEIELLRSPSATAAQAASAPPSGGDPAYLACSLVLRALQLLDVWAEKRQVVVPPPAAQTALRVIVDRRLN